MGYTIRLLFAVIILFSFCNCNTRTEYNHDCTINDSTITSDPFRSFTPDIYTSIAQNNKYEEVLFHGVMCNVNIDTIYYEDIKDSLIFVTSGFKGANFLLNIPRRICLPENGNKLEVEIIYEYAPYPNVTDLFLETGFYNKNTIKKEYTERISSTMDLVHGQNTKSIKKENITIAKYQYEIPKNANNVQVALYTYDKKAVECLYSKDSISIAEVGGAYLALKTFGFKVNGKPLEEYAYDHKIPFTKQETDNIRSNVNDSLKINDDARIVGIGESIHGNSAFYNQANELIKQLIAEGFTLIGFETPITAGIKLNDYITGRNNDNIDTILSKNNTLNFYNNSVTKELFDYLKTYNKSHNNRISIFGFDIPQGEYKDDSKEYLKNNFKINKVEIFNEYLKNFHNKYGSYYKGRMPFELLQRHRDKIMSENIFYIDSCFSNKNKIVLVAHLGHLYKRESPDPSAGFFLSEKYGKQYNVIGLFTGKGSFLSQNYEGFSKERIIKQFPLSTPIGKSLEQLCNTFDKNILYINNLKEIELLDKVLYSFYIGNSYEAMQFEPIDIRKELDNICFIKDSDAY